MSSPRARIGSFGVLMYVVGAAACSLIPSSCTEKLAEEFCDELRIVANKS